MIISGPSGVGKGTLVKMLIDKYPKVFGKKASHTVRPPQDGEIDGVHYHFIDQDKFNIMRDGDQFLEFNNFNDNDYATSRKVVEGIIASGKIPIMEMDYHGIQQLKDQNYPARYIFLATPSMEELERRLRSRGLDSDEEIKLRMKIAEEEVKHSEIEGFHDKIIINDDLPSTFTELESYVFGKEAQEEMTVATEVNTSVEEKAEIIPEALEMDGVTGTA